MEGSGVTPLGLGRAQHVGNELGLRHGINLHGLRCARIMDQRELTFERLVLSRRLRMCAQVVPERQVLPFLLSCGLAQMNVMRARPLGWLVKQGIHQIEVAQRDMPVPECSHRFRIATVRRQRSD